MSDPFFDKAAARQFADKYAVPVSERNLPQAFPGGSLDASRCVAKCAKPWVVRCCRPGLYRLANGTLWCDTHSPMAVFRRQLRKAAAQ
jgi:hypothetical protein